MAPIMKSLFLSFCFSLSLATPVPEGFTSAPVAEPQTRDVEDRSSSGGGFRNVAYFVDWAIYGRNFQPQNLTSAGTTSQLTHLLYSFANVHPDTGAVYLADTYADTDKHYPTDSWNDVGTNVYGCAKQLYIIKKHNRNLKTLLSIGGWTYSSNFAGAASTAANRATFASTAVGFLQNLGFDGIDIDWEFPADDTQAGNFVLLLQAVRSALNAYALKYNINSPLLISVAVSAGPTNYNIMHLAAMDQYVDMWNLMAYDYAGSWSTVTGHQANLYPNSAMPGATPFSTDKAITDYIAKGVPANKINLGMPLYGRSFEATKGLGQPYSGIGSGSWENGVWDYKVLPKAGATVATDATSGATYSYDPASQELISFDTPAMISQKAAYVRNRGLGGAMFWETSSDRVGSQSLIGTAAGFFAGVGGLEYRTNGLGYPGSMYANMVAGMPGA